jgi:hypothetical protein
MNSTEENPTFSRMSKDELVREIVRIMNQDGENFTDGECMDEVAELLESDGYEVFPNGNL